MPSFRVELAPLIDIIFILLIFFAVSSSLVLDQGMRLDMPEAESIAHHKKGLIVSIDQRQRVFLDGQPLAMRNLKDAITAAVKQNSGLQVIFHADKTISYDTVMSALDAIRLGGCQDIVLEAKPKI